MENQEKKEKYIHRTKCGTWEVHITQKRKLCMSKTFKTKQEAIEARDKAVKEIFKTGTPTDFTRFYDNLIKEGTEIGQLTVGKPFQKETCKNKENLVWYHCVCSCGKKTDVRHCDLTTRRVTSCGCSRLSYNRVIHKNNTTGIKGVSFVQKVQKYRADIQHNGKKHYLGTFNRLQDAVHARQLAEEKIKNGEEL